MVTGADKFTPEARAAVMRAVRGRDTGPELIVRAAVRALGRGYRLHDPSLPGSPDLVFKTARRVIFVHGCFWHGHACKRGARAPKANADYWRAKIARNRARDADVLCRLAALGWRALVVWECETRDGAALERRLAAYLA